MAVTRARLCRILLTAVVVAAILLAAAELVARALYDAPPEPYARHPLVGLGWSPNYSFERTTIDDPAHRFTLEVNPLGFRGRAMRTAKKPEGAYRIFFLGASTTENAFLEEERTFAGRIQTALDARFAGTPRIEVANAGVAGTTVAVTLGMLLHRVLPLEPDVVLVLEGHNDLSDALRSDWDVAQVPVPERPPTFKDWLVGASRIMALADSAKRRHQRDKRWWYQNRRRDRRSRPFTKPGFDVKRGIPEYERQLRRIAWLVQDQGAVCVFLTQPSLYKDVMKPEEEAALHMGLFGDGQNYDTPTLKLGLDAYNEATRRVAQATGSILVDCAREVPPDLAHLVDDVHLTAKGNEAIAQAILRVVFSGESLPRPSAR